jgi:ATP-dependent DNA helicase RecG
LDLQMTQMTPRSVVPPAEQHNRSFPASFDEEFVEGPVLDDLPPELWQRFRSPRVTESRDVLLDKLAMARPDADGVLRPTVAGVLMATRDPRRWLPNAFIQAAAYRGTEILPDAGQHYQIDARDITGPLDQQVLEACHFVGRNMRVEAIKQMDRRDLPQFDLTAVFEAVVNAVAHRDYSIYGAKIRLRLFSDRLELYSPGAIPNTMTVESLPYRQAARNEAITSLLAQCPIPADDRVLTDRNAMMDKRGEGVRVILDSSERLSGKHAYYRLIDESELLRVIPAASFSDAPN